MKYSVLVFSTCEIQILGFLGLLLLYNVQIIVQVKVVTIKKKHFCHWSLYQNSFLYRIFFSHRVTTGFFVGFKLLPPGSCVRFPSVKVNRFRHSVPSAIALLDSNLERLYLDWFFFFPVVSLYLKNVFLNAVYYL